MKRFYTLLLVMFVFTGFLFAQPLTKSAAKKEITTKENVRYNKFLPEKNKISKFEAKKSSKSSAGRWYDYAITMQNKNFPDGNADNRNWEYLFPDTTIIEKYTNGAQAPWFHSVGIVLDPTDIVFHDDALFNMTKVNWAYPVDTGQYCKYTIDSVGIPTIYTRNIPNVNIVDTLAIEFITNLHKPVYYFSGQAADWGFDRTYFKSLEFDAMLNYVKTDVNVGYKLVKIPLTDADSSMAYNGYIKLKEILGTADIAGGTGLAAVTFRFIPGYSWNPDDTLNVSMNNFRFFAYEENGQGVAQFPRYDTSYYNLTSFMTTQSLQAGGWQGIYIPRLAYSSNTYPYDNALADIHVTCKNVGIAENKSKSVRLTQNYPNPADKSTEIYYEIKQANNVNFVISDMTGREIMNLNQGKQNAGVHTLTLNTSNLANGLYYFTLNADNERLTKKMIVNR